MVRMVDRRVSSLLPRQTANPKGHGAGVPAGTVVAFGKAEDRAQDRLQNLFFLMDVIDRTDLSVEEMLRSVVESFPVVLGGADKVSVRIVIGAIAVQTKGFAVTLRKRSVPIVVGAETVGAVELYRRDGVLPVAGAGENDEIIETIALRLGKALERRQADRERDDSRERYHRLMDLLPDAVLVHRGGRIVDANPAAADLLAAMTVADLKGRPFLDFVHPDFHDRVAGCLAGYAKGTGRERTFEIKMVRLDDGVIDVEAMHGATVIGGEVVLQSVIRDVTREKREEALSQIGQLTPREYQVMRLVAAGETSKAIALRLGLSPKTVEVHRANVMRKMGVRTLADLIRKKEMIGVP